MLRFTLMLVVMVATLAINSDLMAQHRNLRNPFQSIGRQLGMGWGAGYHSANPGPINDYYSPWTTSNIPGLQRFQAPTIEPGGFEGSSYGAPRLPAPFPDLKVDSNEQSNPLFQDSRDIERPNTLDQGNLPRPSEQEPNQAPSANDWEISSTNGPIKGIANESQN